MENLNLSQLLDAVLPLSRDAGEKILKIYETKFSVETKDDDSPLTAADMAAHHCLVKGLEALTPAYPIISEESATLPFSERSQWQTYWLIDPLDGTREFVKRNGEFTVNVALIHKHTSVLGVVYVPVTKQCYYAAEGLGAFKLEDASQLEDRTSHLPIQTRTPAPEKAMVAGSRSHPSKELAAYLEKLNDYDIMSVGSSLKFCLVAEGKADIYPRLGPTSEWDTGAAQCVLEQAGGQVTDLNGKTLAYNTKDNILNPSFLASGDTGQDWTQYAKPIE